MIGTVGILEQAASKKLLNLDSMLARLLATNFRIDDDLVNQIVTRNKQT